MNTLEHIKELNPKLNWDAEPKLYDILVIKNTNNKFIHVTKPNIQEKEFGIKPSRYFNVLYKEITENKKVYKPTTFSNKIEVHEYAEPILFNALLEEIKEKNYEVYPTKIDWDTNLIKLNLAMPGLLVKIKTPSYYIVYQNKDGVYQKLRQVKYSKETNDYVFSDVKQNTLKVFVYEDDLMFGMETIVTQAFNKEVKPWLVKSTEEEQIHQP